MILKSLFAINPATGLPPFRIYLLRLYYILMIVVLGKDVWTTILTHQEAWEPMRAVGYSLWGTFAVLSIIGLLHPVKMLPIILLNITYKIIWLAIVAYPLWSSGELEGSGAEGLTKSNFTANIHPNPISLRMFSQIQFHCACLTEPNSTAHS